MHDMQRNLSLQLYTGKSRKQSGMLISMHPFVNDKPLKDKNKIPPKLAKKLPLFYTAPIFHAKDNDPL
jgi:hypothetical protein